jgi:uncharacterized protein (DUF1499 family)
MSSEQTTSQIEVVEQQLKPHDKWNYLRLHFRDYLNKHNSCIKIQKCVRGYYLRKELIRQNDNYTFIILNKCLDKYISDLNFNIEINSLLSKKEEMKISHRIYLKILLN